MNFLSLSFASLDNFELVYIDYIIMFALYDN